ncbi:MAG: DUF6305 family protein [Bauldia sp.]
MTDVSLVLRRCGAAFAFVLAASAPSAMAAEKLITFDAPASVTCIGQCEDGEALEKAVQRAGVEPKFDNKFDVKDFEDTKTLFLTIGAAPNVDVKNEIARANRLIDEAGKEKAQVVIVQITARQASDTATEQLLKAVVPRANVIITIPDVDPDGMIQKMADAGGIPLRSAKSKTFLPELIKAAFGSGT